MKNLKKHQYILRYYLPVKPNFSEEYTEKRFCELLEFCKTCDIEAVMFFVALAPDYYYMPDTPEYTETWRNQMLPYIKRLKEAGISYQLNFQNTLGATTKGLNFSHIYGWENIVDYTGRESKGCACPLGKNFREQTEIRLRLWAETKPDIIWLDDDFRLHNHGTPLGAVAEGKSSYADFYCFCDTHIKLFNEQYHTNYTREEIVAGITKTGAPSPLRHQYLDFLSDTMTESAHWMESVIHTASPDTKIALMTSMPDTHAAEGRAWNPFLSSLCGKDIPILRPTFGPYKDQEQPPKEFISSYRNFAMLNAQMREANLNDVIYCPEIENTQFTVWSKSASATTFQLALSAFLGCPGTTLSIYDLDGGAFSDEPLYETMLTQQKPILDCLTALELSSARNLGVGIPVSQESGRSYQLQDGDNYATLSGSKRYIEKYFLQMGIPCQFVSPKELTNVKLVALDGYSAGFLTDEELLTVFQSNVFLDGNAANVLSKRGFGQYIGIRQPAEKSTVPVQAEEIVIDWKRPDGTEIRMPTRITVGNRYDFLYSDTTEVLTRFVTPLGERIPAMTCFTNALGGKAVIYPARENWSSAFYNHQRVAFWKHILQKLDPTLPQIDCNSYTLAVVKETESQERYYFLANLSTDPTKTFTINGKTVEIELSLFQAAIYHELNGQINLIGKTESCI